MFFFGTVVEDYVLHPQKHRAWVRLLLMAQTIERVDALIQHLRLKFALKIEVLDPRGAAEYVRVQSLKVYHCKTCSYWIALLYSWMHFRPSEKFSSSASTCPLQSTSLIGESNYTRSSLSKLSGFGPCTGAWSSGELPSRNSILAIKEEPNYKLLSFVLFPCPHGNKSFVK